MHLIITAFSHRSIEIGNSPRAWTYPFVMLTSSQTLVPSTRVPDMMYTYLRSVSCVGDILPNGISPVTTPTPVYPVFFCQINLQLVCNCNMDLVLEWHGFKHYHLCAFGRQQQISFSRWDKFHSRRASFFGPCPVWNALENRPLFRVVLFLLILFNV